MIVVTGAKGIIGRAVVSQLIQSKKSVTPVSRDTFDLTGSQSLTSITKEKPQGIIHLAAAVPHSLHYPDNPSSADITRKIDHCIFEAASEWNCRVVYASTCSLYDKRSSEIMVEETPIFVKPESPYLAAKNEGEGLFATLPSYAIMRVPAPLGPGLPTTVVARQFFDLAASSQPIRLWGSGKREQNFVDVRDIAVAFIKACDSSVKGVFNIAANGPTTMLELAQATVKVVGAGRVEFANITDPLEYEHTRYSNQRARDLLGWSPHFSLEHTLRYMLEEK